MSSCIINFIRSIRLRLFLVDATFFLFVERKKTSICYYICRMNKEQLSVAEFQHKSDGFVENNLEATLTF